MSIRSEMHELDIRQPLQWATTSQISFTFQFSQSCNLFIVIYIVSNCFNKM